MNKIKISAYSFIKNTILKSELLHFFPDAIFSEPYDSYPENLLAEFLKDADSALVGREKINENLLRQCPNLKFIAKYGVGTDNIDFDACKKYDVQIGWTAGVNSLHVAEHTLGFMIGASHNMFLTNHLLKQGHWLKNGGNVLSGKTVGIIGLGNIGRDLVKLLLAFKCRILANDIEDISEFCEKFGLLSVSKEQIYKESDLITIHTPLTEQTHRMIGEMEFALMKETVIIVNAARGGIINENDLKQALKYRRISAACLDVFEKEPPEDQELLELPNLFVTPHIAGNSVEAVLAMGRSALEHLKKYYEKS